MSTQERILDLNNDRERERYRDTNRWDYNTGE